MRTSSKAIGGVIAGLALLIMAAVPASANTVSVSIAGGNIKVYGPFSTTPSTTIAFTGGGGGGCPTTNSVTATGGATGTITATINSISVITNPYGDGINYVASLSVTVSGSYSGSGSAITFSNQSATAYLQRQGSGCTPDPSYGTCTISVSGIDEHGGVSSGMTSGTLPTLASGDTATVAGENGDFETGVSDTGTSCGAFIAIDNGRVEFTADLVVD